MNSILVISIIIILAILFWALFSKEESSEREINNELPEQIFRRRIADKEIEERYPDSKDQPAHRRKSDISREDKYGVVDDEFSLPHLIDEIIPETSRFRIYRRTLLNGEIYARKGDSATAISLYEGVNERIRDTDVNTKILENIEYIQKYEENQQRKKREDLERRQREARSNEIKLSIDGPFSIPEKIRIGVDTPVPPPKTDVEPQIDTNKIAEEITKKIVDAKVIDIERERERLVEEHKTEIDELKNKISQLIESRDEADVEDKNKKEIQKYESEIEALKDEINQLVTFKEESQRLRDEARMEEEIQRQKEAELSKLREEMQNISDAITQLSKDEKKTQEDLHELKLLKDKQESEAQAAKLKKDIYNDIRREIEREINNKLVSQVIESEKKPTLTEVKFDSPGPAEPEVKTDLDKLGAMPSLAPPEPETIEFKDNKQDEIDATTKSEATPKEARIDENKSDAEANNYIKTTEDEENYDFELLSEYGRDDDTDRVSDEDIFRKIMADDKKRERDAFEIIGDKREDDDLMYDITDSELEKKQSEEEKFYKKFLQHERRKKKELPILKVSYDFTKLPDEFSLSREQNILEHSFYKFKPMLEKANGFIQRRRVRDAINYYKVVMSQNIPPEFKSMIRKNINDLTEYLEKYLTTD
ncbi:MAG: hypothetical protein SVZ03_09775 [Spirochaetota bacterium]|nr:hypothetical protein [Spirochaetota bacterium]